VKQGKELLVGFVIIIAITVAVVGSLWLQGTNFGQVTSRIEVLLESAGQLSEGNVVSYRGVSIGHVATIAVEPGGTSVRVTFLVDDGVALPDDAAVVLGPESLFGDWQAEIVSRASYDRFPFYDVPASEGSDPLVLGGYAIPELTRLTASAEQISENLADLTNRLELAFNQETANNLASAITNIEAITQEVRALVQQQSALADRLTTSADNALAEVTLAASSARSSLERVHGRLDDPQVDSIMTNMRIASEDMRMVMDELADEQYGLSATLDRVDSTFSRVDRIAARVEAGEGSLGRLLVDSTFALRAEDMLLQLDLLLQDVRANPRRYVRLSIF
jgi:phospholipid/cholesterol/gamma-HCH transport system substrate-binding protein